MCVVGRGSDAALTRFVYHVDLSRKVRGCASRAVLVFLRSPAGMFAPVAYYSDTILFVNSLRNVSILTVAMRSQPANKTLLDAYWSHNIPVCEIFCVYPKSLFKLHHHSSKLSMKRNVRTDLKTTPLPQCAYKTG